MPTMKDNLKPLYFNMVNLDNERLIKLGLKPLYLKAYPRFINKSGNIFYNDPSHYNCNLKFDIKEILNIMNSNTYDRFNELVYYSLNDNYSIHFNIYNSQIFFSDLFSLNVYKTNQKIRNEINKKYHLPEFFYEPTEKEIFESYDFKYLLKNKDKYGTKMEHCTFNLTPQEYFNIVTSAKRIILAPYEDANELSGHDIRYWLNYNANIIMDHKCSRNTTGIYNKETMMFINSLKETKLDIYLFFDQLSKQSKNWQKLVKDLLIELCVYSPFIPKENEDFMDDPMQEASHWNSMFNQAALDILVQFVGLDKIETQLPKTITTTKSNIYEEYFNPLVLGYNIVQIPKLIFDEEKQQLRWIKPQELINTGINRECENEIKLIKKYVPFDQRYKYLRK